MRLYRHEAKLGFYGNFERALSLVPANAELIALADQDDEWYPEKLEVLATRLEREPEAMPISQAMKTFAPGRVSRRFGVRHAPRLRTDTRFVVVTHNPITMARMDRLFGVTMAERGVSQLVSVDLQTAEQYREAV